MRVSLLAAFIAASLTSAQQPQTGAIAGTITDTSGGGLPGVTITLVGPKSGKAVTSATGEYRIDDLIVGEYRVEATLPGFRKGVATVTVQQGVTTKADIALRLGLLSIVDYIMPKDGVQGAVREAAVVAQIRLTGIARTRLAEGESLIVTDHDSTVLTVVKADAPGIVPGSALRFGQNNAGLWVEEGYRAVGLERPYSPGDSFVAFLMRDKDSSLREFRGEWYMWPVKQGFVVIETPGPLSGLRSPMPVDEALAALRKLLGAKNPEPR